VVDLAVEHVLVSGAQLLADKLVDLGVDAASAAGAKCLFSRLRPKQEAKEVFDFQIALPDDGWIQVEPPERGSTVEIVTRGGGTVTTTRSAQEE
jgi:hypothetical protein